MRGKDTTEVAGFIFPERITLRRGFYVDKKGKQVIEMVLPEGTKYSLGEYKVETVAQSTFAHYEGKFTQSCIINPIMSRDKIIGFFIK